MSYLSMYTIHQDGSAKEYRTFGNAHRGAMLIWMRMVERYLPGKNIMSVVFGDDDKLLWDLAKTEKVKQAHRIVHANTFDRVAVKRENFPRLIAAMKTFSEDFSDPGHVPAQAAALEEIQDNEDVVAVSWNQTSVTESYWSPTYDEEENEIPFDLGKSELHWFLFDDSGIVAASAV